MPPELAFEPVRQRIWRAVEAQHHVSTLRLVAHSADDHEILENLLEESKPAIPEAARRLHYLLATPFRYPSPHGSRFRAPGDPGVFYGAVERRTACAELGYWRWRFVAASEGLRELAATPQTLFQAGVEGRGLDLRQPPWLNDRARWTDPEDYRSTQRLAQAARSTGTDAIVYESVRDPQHAACVAVLRAGALRPGRPLAQETWFLAVTARGVVWTREGRRFVFQFAS